MNNNIIEEEYDVILDSRKRAILKGDVSKNYHVTKYTNGMLILEPTKIVSKIDNKIIE
jgi:hypothetical protein